jgi:hypothetical protein
LSLEALQGGIECAVLDQQFFTGPLLNGAGDALPMFGAKIRVQRISGLVVVYERLI